MGVFEENSSNIFQSGFRIYTLKKDGPLDKAGAKVLSDFIIPPDEVLNQILTFKDWISSIEDKTIKIKLYSLLTCNFRIIEIKANKYDSKDGILGAGVKFENYENAAKKLLHITSVKENSFAKDKLGLIPNDDYIIAVKAKNANIISLNNKEYNPLEILNIMIKENKGNDLLFFIYNKKNGPRTVEVNIGNDNEFVLGCDVAYGALHEFPKEKKEIIEEITEKEKNTNKMEEKNNDSHIDEINENKINKSEEVIEEDII